ncbi:MAG: FeoA domain-containing protein [Candidatus Bathyarchaeia archaeon]
MNNPEELLPCLLEVLATFEMRGENPDSNSIVKQISEVLGHPENEVKEAMSLAIRQGFLQRDGCLIRLTEKGRNEVLRHRESFVHDRYIHPSMPFGRIVRLLDGSIKNWRLHWKSRHGLDEKALEGLYDDLRDFQGRIENAIPLPQLREGKRGVVAFTFGGRGMVQRLAEMGLTPGTEVTVVREAPFHGPIEVRVRGVSLALGYGVASRIFVKPLE